MLVALVPAAGASRRFGSQKLLQRVNGVPLVRLAVEQIVAAGPERIVVVVGTDGEAVRHALAGLPVTIVENPHPEQGLSSSLRAGLAAVPAAAESVMVALGDQPITHAEVIPTMIAHYGGDREDIIAPRYRGLQGLPVIFRRAVFSELEALTGDRGARAVVERDPSRVAFVDFDFPMPPDVDTPDDLRTLAGS